jgi:flagellar biosynthesis/type III secretory pathway protein FliH
LSSEARVRAPRAPAPASAQPAQPAHGEVIARCVLPRRPRAVRIVTGTAAQFVARERELALAAAFERGRVAGDQSARTGAAGALEAASERLDEACQRLAPELATSAVELAIEIARSLVRIEVSAGRHALERIVRETLAASSVGRGACTVHLSPADAARLEGVAFRANTRIEADPEIEPGDVHVSSPQGLLVREIDEALASIREKILGELAP